MTRVAMFGLGSLGMPVALAMEKHGHDVLGHDPGLSARPWDSLPGMPKLPWFADPQRFRNERGIADLLAKTKIRNVSPGEAVEHAELIFVAVQTPHEPWFGGEGPLHGTRKDFNYAFLREALRTISMLVHNGKPETPVVVVSTVLPGTLRRLRASLPPMRLLYNPSFIAMGAVIEDFEHPEFVLVGRDAIGDEQALLAFYETIVPDARPLSTSIENAELIKVAYNTAIGLKIVFANTLMEICHKIPGCDVDEVTRALGHATKRLVSTAYTRGGMGDSGACHPRDNIAMSWLARELGLRHDLFHDVMTAREDQARWLADLVVEQHRRTGLPIVILGTAYKPETHLQAGSCSLLLEGILKERGYAVTTYDPFVTGAPVPRLHRAVFFHATAHARFSDWEFPAGSVVIDPWRSLRAHVQTNITYIPVGVGR